jgi:hypothetical protein
VTLHAEARSIEATQLTNGPRASCFVAQGRGTPGSIRRRPALIGEHTDEILASLGYDRAEIDSCAGKRWCSPDSQGGMRRDDDLWRQSLSVLWVPQRDIGTPDREHRTSRSGGVAQIAPAGG